MGARASREMLLPMLCEMGASPTSTMGASHSSTGATNSLMGATNTSMGVNHSGDFHFQWPMGASTTREIFPSVACQMDITLSNEREDIHSTMVFDIIRALCLLLRQN